MEGYKQVYEPWITIKKGLGVIVYGAVGAGIAYFSGLEPTVTIVCATALLKMAENYLKNYKK